MNQKQQELVQEVLRYVNKARVLMGLNELLDLPKGSQSDPESCPIARALGNNDPDFYPSVDSDWINWGDEDLSIDIAKAWECDSTEDQGVSTPKPFQDFLDLFDSGELPEYDADPDPDDDDDEPEDEDAYD